MGSEPKRYAYLAAMMLGAASVSGQIILMREIMVLFYGNELSAGVCLLVWLLWTAIGSLAGSIIVKQRPIGMGAVIGMLLSIAVLLPLTVIFCRVAKTIIGISQGEIIGIGLITAIAGVSLSIFCLISGLFFPALIRSASGGDEDDNDAPSRMYLLESVGSSIFGLITSLILIRFLDALMISFIIGAVVAVSAMTLSIVARRALPLVLSLTIAVFFALSPIVSSPDIGAMTRRLQWKDFTVAESTDTPYGNLIVTTAGSQITFYDNGVLSFTYPDVMSTEQNVIYPLLLHPSPKRVLLVGGGISSTLSQILKHPSVTEIDYVELDPALIELGKRHLPPEATSPLSDPRVRVIHTDGRLFVKESHELYDVIIVNMADPVNVRINRYFTREFFAEVKSILSIGGVFSISVGASEDIISPVLASFLGGVSSTLSAVFPHTSIIPGERTYFVASDLASRVDLDPTTLIGRMKQRGIVNSYVTENFLLYRLNAERIEYARRSIENANTTGINTDLSPTVYYYDMVLRSYWLSPGMKIILADLAKTSPAIPTAGLVIIAIFYSVFLFIRYRRNGPSPTLAIAPVVVASGFSEIALTVVIIIAFQSFYGYVYSSLGLIISFFMIGLAIGTLLWRRRIRRVTRPRRTLVVIQICYAAFCLVVAAVLIFFSAYGSTTTWWGIHLIFSFLNMFCGMLCAAHYVTAVNVLTSSGAPPVSGGWVYGMNLSGAAAGALICSVVMIPIWGLVISVLLVGLVDICAAGLTGFGMTLMRSNKRLITTKKAGQQSRP